MTTNLTKVMELIAGDVLKLSHIIFADNGIATNPKSGKNTLKNSELEDSIKINMTQANDSVVIETLFNNYIDYIEQGRKPMTGKQPPMDAIRDWALSKGIPTDNSTLFLISRAIWRDGQQGRPILSKLEEEIEKAFDEKWADLILESITEELTKYFE